MSISSIRAARELEQAVGDGQRQQVEQQKTVRQELSQQANSAVDRKRNLTLQIINAKKELANAEAEEETKKRKAGRVNLGANIMTALAAGKTLWDMAGGIWNQANDNNRVQGGNYGDPNSEQGARLRISDDLRRNRGVEVDPADISVTRREDGGYSYNVPAAGERAAISGEIDPFRMSEGDGPARNRIVGELRDRGFSVRNPERDIQITHTPEGIRYSAQVVNAEGRVQSEPVTGRVDNFDSSGGFSRVVVAPILKGLTDNLQGWEAVVKAKENARDANDQQWQATQRKNNARKQLSELMKLLGESGATTVG